MAVLTVRQISDTHLSRTHAYFQDNRDAFVEYVADDPPDFVFVTGDMCFNVPANPDDLAYARGRRSQTNADWSPYPPAPSASRHEAAPLGQCRRAVLLEGV